MGNLLWRQTRKSLCPRRFLVLHTAIVAHPGVLSNSATDIGDRLLDVHSLFGYTPPIE